MITRLLITCLIISGCSRPLLQVRNRNSNLTGTEFYNKASSFSWQQRDTLVVKEILGGNMPVFLKKLVPVTVHYTDSVEGDVWEATYYVTPDYLSVGTDIDWARINITPMAAQKIADSLGCFLPTRKMVDDIYRAAVVKPEPVPMFAFRDSSPTMYHHHLIIEGQRKQRAGLIAGIKKDVVISGRLLRENKNDRVAIYGWHKSDGKPIQPLYTGHINWWVDYSQGIRLVHRKVRVKRKGSKAVWMDYTEILNDPVLRKLLCDEDNCDFHKYSY